MDPKGGNNSAATAAPKSKIVVNLGAKQTAGNLLQNKTSTADETKPEDSDGIKGQTVQAITSPDGPITQTHSPPKDLAELKVYNYIYIR